MPDPFSSLSRYDTFRFHCSPERACFNACCRDLQQALTPYDIICLKNFLGISSTAFLKQYTEENIGLGTGFPVVSLRFGDSAHLTCPFVTPAGCGVYAARPASCRTYPLARGISRNRKTDILTEQWALIREPHCLGFESDIAQTIDTWVADQQIGHHNQMNDMLLELISDKNRLHPGAFSPLKRQQVYTALYDIDRFRERIFSSPQFPEQLFAPEDIDSARQDDEALLKVAMVWIRHILFTVTRQD